MLCVCVCVCVCVVCVSLSHTACVSQVGIAPAASFNTAPPFYLTHTPSSFVLHLMFEPYGGLRRRIFAALEACIEDRGGGMDARKVQMLVSEFPSLAEASYLQEMDQGTQSEDLMVMFAQLLWTVYGRARGREVLDLYARAVEIAPNDPDTHRILGVCVCVCVCECVCVCVCGCVCVCACVCV